ncbi:hypothetical protein Snoj_35670 [Streptomyces nojiriensis]|uniref:Lipoprotein n=1 Tax=Streptomyces nojiriensis TaxID=66374 RepID=A0ABQ3SNG2_9ACTN|nr:hypothetical protein [Streptomyces nojiriensis]QTI43206.1 hypothetical protein JYK04_00968 [Streptomyces nojiriensis]GGS31169.1 hypothetical protein GCM10010205_71750 [Streptomyces nojiriensis]GHI69649.1 hypothetical protein Snoj_35670 [Streptomyces nojiriensis]
MNQRSGRLLGMAVAASVGLVGCGSSAPSDGPAPESRPSAVPAYVVAYRAGHTAGKAVYDSTGKGAAVRETVWGGCTRRALQAGSDAEVDRGSWVRGCLHGVTNGPERLPTGPVTERTADSEMLERFRARARTKGEAPQVDHARALVVARLTEHDYDVELSTDYSAGSGTPEAESLARSFVESWDGDSGRDGTARNVLVLGPSGERLAAQRI